MQNIHLNKDDRRRSLGPVTPRTGSADSVHISVTYKYVNALSAMLAHLTSAVTEISATPPTTSSSSSHSPTTQHMSNGEFDDDI